MLTAAPLELVSASLSVPELSIPCDGSKVNICMHMPQRHRRRVTGGYTNVGTIEEQMDDLASSSVAVDAPVTESAAEDDDDFLDPITSEIICDPVLCRSVVAPSRRRFAVRRSQIASSFDTDVVHHELWLALTLTLTLILTLPARAATG